jgi:hypothetical protein
MPRLQIWIAAVSTAALLAVTAHPARAQEPFRLEFFVKGALTPSGAITTYNSSYDPHPGYEIPGSYARQTLNIDPLSGWGLRAGMIAHLGTMFGLRLSAGWDETPIGGNNPDFQIYYKYTAWLPPMTDPTYGARLTTVEWPATSGRLRRTTASLEMNVRIPLSPLWTLNLSAGPLLSFFSGEVDPLGYEEVVYERYGSQIFKYYFVLLRLPPQTSLGFAGEAEAAFRIDRHVSLLLGAVLRSGTYAATPEISSCLDYHTLQEAPAEIMARLKALVSPAPLTLTPSPFLFSLVLAVGF